MPLYMATTTIPAERTAQEIATLLAQAGATQILTEYGPDRQIIGLRWIMTVEGKDVPFEMPVRIEPVFSALRAKISPRNREKLAAQTRAQAKRVAWRQLLRWVQAQLSFLDTGMVTPAQAFAPYLEVRRGVTLFQHFANGLKALPEPRS